MKPAFQEVAHVKIWANGKHIYSFSTIEVAWAMSKAHYLMVVLSEHSYNFFEPEKENGRKIYWYGLPATVVPSDYYPGEIRIKPDYTTIQKDEWWKEYKSRKTEIGGKADKEWEEMERENDAEHEQDDMINWGDALSDGHINWFRKR